MGSSWFCEFGTKRFRVLYRSVHTTYLKAKKTEKNNEGFNNLHIILLIHVYALAKKRQAKMIRHLDELDFDWSTKR